MPCVFGLHAAETVIKELLKIETPEWSKL
jgi:hypothetical protein